MSTWILSLPQKNLLHLYRKYYTLDNVNINLYLNFDDIRNKNSDKIFLKNLIGLLTNQDIESYVGREIRERNLENDRIKIKQLKTNFTEFQYFNYIVKTYKIDPLLLLFFGNSKFYKTNFNYGLENYILLNYKSNAVDNEVYGFENFELLLANLIIEYKNEILLIFDSLLSFSFEYYVSIFLYSLNNSNFLYNLLTNKSKLFYSLKIRDSIKNMLFLRNISRWQLIDDGNFDLESNLYTTYFSPYRDGKWNLIYNYKPFNSFTCILIPTIDVYSNLVVPEKLLSFNGDIMSVKNINTDVVSNTFINICSSVFYYKNISRIFINCDVDGNENTYLLIDRSTKYFFDKDTYTITINNTQLNSIRIIEVFSQNTILMNGKMSMHETYQTYVFDFIPKDIVNIPIIRIGKNINNDPYNIYLKYTDRSWNLLANTLNFIQKNYFCDKLLLYVNELNSEFDLKANSLLNSIIVQNVPILQGAFGEYYINNPSHSCTIYNLGELLDFGIRTYYTKTYFFYFNSGNIIEFKKSGTDKTLSTIFKSQAFFIDKMTPYKEFANLLLYSSNIFLNNNADLDIFGDTGKNSINFEPVKTIIDNFISYTVNNHYLVIRNSYKLLNYSFIKSVYCNGFKIYDFDYYFTDNGQYILNFKFNLDIIKGCLDLDRLHCYVSILDYDKVKNYALPIFLCEFPLMDYQNFNSNLNFTSKIYLPVKNTYHSRVINILFFINNEKSNIGDSNFILDVKLFF